MATTDGLTPTGGKANWDTVQLVDNTTLKGSNQVTPGAATLTGDTVFGGPTNLMGWTDLDDTKARSTDFGFAVRCSVPTGGGRVGIDYVSVTIYYTDPSGVTGSVTVPVAVYGNPCVRYERGNL